MNVASLMPSEVAAVVATVDPQTVASTAKTSDVVDMSKFHAAMFILALGDMAAETIDFRIQYCDSDGGNAGTLKAATQLAAHASNNDNKQIVLECRAEDLLAISETTRYVRGYAVTGNTTGGSAAVIGLGFFARSGVASDNDLASVAEIARP